MTAPRDWAKYYGQQGHLHQRQLDYTREQVARARRRVHDLETQIQRELTFANALVEKIPRMLDRVNTWQDAPCTGTDGCLLHPMGYDLSHGKYPAVVDGRCCHCFGLAGTPECRCAPLIPL